MQVSAIDHVNIITNDLDGTASFYEGVLGLKRTDSPGSAMGFKGAWLRDASDNAIVHLMWNDPGRDLGAGHVPGDKTAAIHHVAFRCEGFDGARARLEGMGIAYRVNDREFGGLRQLFVTDPNNISLELNFPGD